MEGEEEGKAADCMVVEQVVAYIVVGMVLVVEVAVVEGMEAVHTVLELVLALVVE